MKNFLKISAAAASLFFSFALASLAAGEIKASDTAGKTVYAEILSGTQPWNGTTFETYTDADWANYKVPLTEQGTSQVYVGTFPAGIAASGRYSVTIYEQQGGSPLPSDTIIAQGAIEWTGTTLATLATDVAQSTTAASQSTTAASQSTTAASQSTSANTKLGTPAGASVSADIASVKSDTGGLTTSVAALPGLVWSVGTRTITGGTVTLPADFLSSGEQAKLLLASTAQQAGSPVTLPTTAPTGYGGSGGGGGIVAGYATGQDPATLLLATPGNKLYTNSSGFVRSDLSQPIDVTQTGQTVGGSLTGAYVQGLGVWKITGTPGTAGALLKEYDTTGTTLIRTFDLSTAGNRQ